MSIVILLIGIGVLFDSLSFLYGVLGIFYKKNMSGFPLVGLICYVTAVMIAVLFGVNLFGFSWYSVGGALVFFHIIMQLPSFAQSHLNKVSRN